MILTVPSASARIRIRERVRRVGRGGLRSHRARRRQPGAVQLVDRRRQPSQVRFERDRLPVLDEHRLEHAERGIRPPPVEQRGLGRRAAARAAPRLAPQRPPIAAIGPAAFVSASASSCSGSESATMAPPTPIQIASPAVSNVRITTLMSSPAIGLAIPIAPV